VANQLSESVGSAETKRYDKDGYRRRIAERNAEPGYIFKTGRYVSGKYNISKSDAVEMIDVGYATRDRDTAYVASGVLMGKDFEMK